MLSGTASLRLCAALLLLFGWPGMSGGTGTTSEPDTQALLRRADRARGNERGVTWNVTVTSREREKEETLKFNISSRGFDLLAVYTAPPRQRNARLLMVNRNMWFHRPGLSKPVPISQRQRLLGKAAYGDLAATNYAEEYDATLLFEEALDGEWCLVFDLKAKTTRATYDRIHYWIARESGLGLQSRFFTLSGKAIKVARMEYENRILDENGQTQPFISRMTIRDELMGHSVTTIEFDSPGLKELPDSVFDLNLLTQ
ncbi:MAG: hypothetical protein BWY59_00360 [Verrucomicrobia bacterium ADurb.Bin345]|nr:MAG: hypothetical protein BWY59_00360 [Verrucomicrobia bacterium ADurb.Bin345]